MTNDDVVKITDKLDQYFAATMQVIEKYGGDAAELGLNVMRIDACVTVATGLLGLVLVYVAIVAGKWAAVRFMKNIDDMEEPEAVGHVVIILCAIIVGIVGIVTALQHLLHMWAWVGMFYPEAYAVHKLIM